MPQELRFSTLKENGADFGNFFPPEVMLDEFFPDEVEEDRRINGKLRKFKDIDEVSNEDVDYHTDFEHWIPELALDDKYDEFEINDLVDAFGGRMDDELTELAFMNAVIQTEEKEDKKLSVPYFVPFSKNKIKCEIYIRKHGYRGLNDSYKNIPRESIKFLSFK